MGGETTIVRNVNQLGVALLIVFILWVASSETNTQRQLAVLDTKIMGLETKANEVVPRSENERRYDSLEKGQSQNAERIGRIEQHIYATK